VTLPQIIVIIQYMKAQIHPDWYPEAKVKCGCGNTFTIGSTVPEIEVEVCSECHPFYTGTQRFVDTAGRVDTFKARQKGANSTVLSKAKRRKIKRERKISEELERPDTLEDIRASMKKKTS